MKNIFFTTLRCNQNCIFCKIPLYFKDFFKEPSFSEIVKKINSIKNTNEIVLTGGEPTLRKDIVKIITFSKHKNLKVVLQTNATKLRNKQYVKILANSGLDMVTIPFHHYDKKIYYKITSNNSFDKVIKGIYNCMMNDIFVELNIVVNNYNYTELKKIVQFIEKKFDKAKLRITFSFVQPFGSALINNKIIPKLPHIKKYLREALYYCKSKKLNFSITTCGFPLCYLKGFEKNSDEYLLIKEYGSTNSYIKNLFKNKVKVKKCQRCGKKTYCLGLWKNYVTIHGESL